MDFPSFPIFPILKFRLPHSSPSFPFFHPYSLTSSNLPFPFGQVHVALSGLPFLIIFTSISKVIIRCGFTIAPLRGMTIATLTVWWLNRRWDDLLAVLGGIYPNTSWGKERNSPGSEKRMYGFRKDRIGTSVFASGLSSERMRCAMESFSSEVFDEIHPEAVLVGMMDIIDGVLGTYQSCSLTSLLTSSGGRCSWWGWLSKLAEKEKASKGS